MLSKLRPVRVAGCAPPATTDPTTPPTSVVASHSRPTATPKGLQYTPACRLQRGIRTAQPGQATRRRQGGTTTNDPPLLFPQNGKPTA